MDKSVKNKSKILYQLQKLRKLSQPFFLPIDQCNGFQFIWLLISLLFCVGGVVLVGLTGIISFFESFQPIFLEKYFGGVVSTVNSIWAGSWGLLFSALFLIGSGSFFSLRRQLKNRRWLHWLFLAIIVLMLLAVNGINAGIGFIARDLTNALVEKQEDGFYRILGIYACCFAVALPIRVSQIFFTYKLGIIWREWLSKSLVKDYMTNKAYYQLNPNDEEQTDVDNPDQRITDDTRAFTGQSLSFTLGIFDALLTFSLNILILWSISTTLTFSLFGYAAFATSILLIAGKNLVSFYHFITVDDLQKIEKIKEVRLKVFLKRDSDLSIPSLYKIFRGSDWQERETYDMYGINFLDHPNPKRLLMPEDWRGWPLRKDYIQPDFYELQDAY